MELTSMDKGARSELLACAWLLEHGYEVFRNVSPNGPADIVAWKPGYNPILLDVKSMTGTARSQKLSPEQIRLGIRQMDVIVDGDDGRVAQPYPVEP